MTARDVITGTHGDKYTTRNPLARLLVQQFLADFAALARRTGARSVVEVGAGEGEVSRRVRAALEPELYLASDLEPWCGERIAVCAPECRYALLSAEALPLRDASVDLVVASEVLEHLSDPRAAVAELGRVARRWIVASVPREPLWRALNLARLRYVADFGNTPGHLQHWSRGEFLALMGSVGRVEEVRSPIPWTIALVRKP